MKILAVLFTLYATAASAQVFGHGAAVYPSPGPHTFLDQPVAQCVIAVPCKWGDCVVLSACPPGTLVSPVQAAQQPAPSPPPVQAAQQPAAPGPTPVLLPLIIQLPVPEARCVACPCPAPAVAPKKK